MTNGGVSSSVNPQRFRFLPRWLREMAFVALVYVAYEATRGLHVGGVKVATRNGWGILHWERAWDLSPEHLLTHALVGVTPLAVAAAYFYSTMHYLITPVVLVWLYRRHADVYRPARTALAISTVIGLVGFYTIPTAPPRLLQGAGVPDALFDVRHWGWWGGEGSVPSGLGGLTNQFAAMPSMHVGWALWCGYLLYRHASRRWVRWLGAAYPVVTTLVVLSTGNHYLVDAVAGAVVMGLGAAITKLLSLGGRRLRALWTARRAHPPATPEPIRPRRPAGSTVAALPAALFGALSLSTHSLPPPPARPPMDDEMADEDAGVTASRSGGSACTWR